MKPLPDAPSSCWLWWVLDDDIDEVRRRMDEIPHEFREELKERVNRFFRERRRATGGPLRTVSGQFSASVSVVTHGVER